MNSKVSRGPNEEPPTTAQENVREGYGRSSKASLISGKPDKGAEAEKGAQASDGSSPQPQPPLKREKP
ncbi:MAG: hypothetical protein C0487_18215 [Leptothrix sp. (in: Bacteria)]|nr:hypothetical protein [Leptothrix sp. (in: b-proteobacteria)]